MPTTAAPSGPLAGVRVIDLTTVLFGVWTTQILGDLGADVIKVEAPPGREGGGGDILRWGGTPAVTPGMGPLFMAYNRNKRSAVLDLKDPETRAALLRLLAGADLFMSNVRRRSLEALGLAYDQVSAANPSIVYVHCAGYGSDGPYRDRPAYDDLIQAASGTADLAVRTGAAAPAYLPGLIADKSAALYAVYAALAALFHRQRTGEGQYVEVPMLECFVDFTLSENLYGRMFDPPTGEVGYPRVLNPNRRPYATADGYLAVLPYDERAWTTVFDLAGMGERFRADPRFADYAGRIANSEDLYGLLAEAIATKSTAEWLDLLEHHDIPAMRVNRLDEVVDDPHLVATGFFEWRTHPSEGRYQSMRQPVRFSATPASIRRHPPLLGEHTVEVLGGD